jgi:hypothetical protein
MGSYEDWSSRAVAPEILQQEVRIRQQWQVIERLEAAGHLDLSMKARSVLREMCSSLIDMRLEERREAIRVREKSFVPVTAEERHRATAPRAEYPCLSVHSAS